MIAALVTGAVLLVVVLHVFAFAMCKAAARADDLSERLIAELGLDPE